MDRRTLLALMLTATVIVLTPILFPTRRAPVPLPTDTVVRTAPDTQAVAPPRATTVAPTAPSPTVGAARPTPGAPTAVRAETTVVRTSRAEIRLMSPGGTPAAVSLTEYPSLRPGTPRSVPVNLIEPGARLFHLHLASDTDTIALDTVRFRAEPQRRDGTTIVQTLTSVSAPAISLTYRFPADSFVFRVDGQVTGTASPTRSLLVTLPQRIRSDEADIADDTRQLAVAYRAGAGEVGNIPFKDLDSLETRADSGAIRWVAERNKYFVVSLIPAGSDSLFRAIYSRAGVRNNDLTTSAFTTAVLPLRSGNFALRVYAGPQSWSNLRSTAPDLENVNPYAGFAHGLVQPFATIVMRMILWMRETFNVSYGWVLVIFGVLVRIALWPLNQNAMRSSMKLQRLQPQMAEIQAKYKDNREKLQQAMMKLYQDHGMSPFTPILGCLPMLIPMPILFALYFVFQNTIELRGVPFFWLPDLSLKDPLYITPLFMGVSMYVLSWLGMRGMPPSPQTKMMLYVMPVMFTVMFWNFASGLNLYYAVQNVAALPQQWLLARERTAKPPLGGGTAPSKPVKT